MSRRLHSLCALLAAAAVLVSGCGGDESPTPDRGERDRSAPRKHAERPPLAGAERLVFIGDSLSLSGGSPTYPELLTGSAGPVVAVENMSEPGTTSADWRPGGELFAARLAPRLEDADAVLITVGGNDLERAVGGSDGPEALGQAGGSGGPTAVVAAMDEIERNLRRTIRGIRRRSPGTQVAFVGYPDYSASSAWRERVGSFELMGLRVGLRELQTRAALAGADLVVDMLDATGRSDADRLLSEGEYLSAAGHRLYARQLGRLLGRGR